MVKCGIFPTALDMQKVDVWHVKSSVEADRVRNALNRAKMLFGRMVQGSVSFVVVKVIASSPG